MGGRPKRMDSMISYKEYLPKTAQYDRRCGVLSVQGWSGPTFGGKNQVSHTIDASISEVSVSLSIDDPADLAEALLLCDIATGRNHADIVDALRVVLIALCDGDVGVYDALAASVVAGREDVG